MIKFKEGDIRIKPDTSMTYLILDQHPLYEYVDENNDIHVLCLGGGKFMRQMILSIASCGQMLDHRLFIHVIAKNAAECLKLLLQEAPELRYYSQIDDTIQADPQYRYVSFTFDEEKNLNGSSALKRVFKKFGHCPYVIVSLGDAETSTAVAGKYTELVSKGDRTAKRIIHYYSDFDKRVSANSGNVKQVPFNSDFSKYKNSLNAMMKRAFRVHYMYSRIYDQTIKTSRSEQVFKGEINQENTEYIQLSSFAAAVHIHYKLKSIGINPAGIHLSSVKKQEIIAKRYLKALSSYRDQLIALEHRRWIMFMISQGYTFPRLHGNDDFFRPDNRVMNRLFFAREADGRYNNRFRSDSMKLHACLVPSTAESKLPEDRAEWDRFQSYEEIDLSKYDLLDKMSLKLHLFAKQRVFSEDYQTRIKYLVNTELKILLGDDLPRVVSMEAFRAFSEYIDLALLGKTSIGFTEARERFYSNCFDLEIETLRAVRSLLDRIENEFAIYNEYNLYHNYKEPDAGIVDHLLWVYCADEALTLVKMYSESSIPNIASCLTMEPEKLIIYGAPKVDPIAEKYQDSGLVDDTSFSVLAGNRDPDTITRDLIALAKQNKRVLIDVTDTSAVLESAAHAAADQNKNVGLIKYDFHSSTITNLRNYPLASIYTLKRSITAEQIFSIGGATVQEENITGKDHLPKLETTLSSMWELYLKTGPWIGDQASSQKKERSYPFWSEICAFFRFFSGEEYAEFYYDYDVKKINFGNQKWTLCEKTIRSDQVQSSGIGDILENAEKACRPPFIRNLRIFEIGNNDTNISFDIPPLGQKLEERFKYLLDNIGFETLRFRAGSSEKNSRIHFICISSGQRKGKNNKKLYSSSCIYIRDALRYTHAGTIYEIKSMERFLEDMKTARLIKNLVFKKNSGADSGYRVSFKFTSPVIPYFFEKTGNLLEIYTWSQMVKCGQFDDVKPNLDFFWGMTNDKGKPLLHNELDVVATRNMTTIVVSCKMDAFQMNHIYSVKHIAETFSTITKPVIVYVPYSLKEKKEDGSEQAISDYVRTQVAEMGVYLIDGRMIASGNLSKAFTLIAQDKLKPKDLIHPPERLLN